VQHRSVRPGHLLVAGRHHASSLHELRPQDAVGVMRLAHQVSLELMALTGERKTYRVVAGDVDRHFTFIRLPPYEGSIDSRPFHAVS
jgi:diadenosine tetraphosphate (Ap4A) HIT family hydrolase